MPRTTLTLDADVLKSARDHARRHRTTLGEATSQLMRRGLQQPLVTSESNGLHVVRLPRDSPKVPSSRVKALQDDR